MHNDVGCLNIKTLKFSKKKINERYLKFRTSTYLVSMVHKSTFVKRHIHIWNIKTIRKDYLQTIAFLDGIDSMTAIFIFTIRFRLIKQRYVVYMLTYVSTFRNINNGSYTDRPSLYCIIHIT